MMIKSKILPWVMDNPRFLLYLTLIAFGFLYGLFHLKKLRFYFKLHVLFMGTVLISEVTSRILGEQINNSMPTYHFLIPIEFLFFGSFYWFAFEKKTKPILIITILGVIISIINSVLIQSLLKFPTYSFLLLLLFVITLSLVHLNKMTISRNSVRLDQNPIFWFNLSGLIFFSTTLFFFGFKNIFNFKNELYDWLIFSITFSTYVLYTYSIILEKKQNSI